MTLDFDFSLANEYKSHSQMIRRMSEKWVLENIYCPRCFGYLEQYPNNKAVADFYCPKCKKDYELKSKKGQIGNEVLGGSYKAMILRIQDQNSPDFFFLAYDNFSVIDFFVLPSFFFTASVIQRRKPLNENTKRAGWIGCKILLHQIPQDGKIFYIKNRKILLRNQVQTYYQKVSFLEHETLKNKGWIFEVMQCIAKLKKDRFDLDEVYQFENDLRKKFPKNKHIRAKIRQQLQFLRDKNYLKFNSNGRYSLVHLNSEMYE